MLWYKAWLETRWRFLIGFVLLMGSAMFTVREYPEVLKLMPLVPGAGVGGAIDRRIQEAAQLARDYRGYAWWQWFGQSLTQMWTLFAVLLGTGGLVTQAFGGGALFTLSMPVSRTRLLGVRVATGLSELLVLAVVPSLLIPLLSPTIGQSYGLGDTLIYSACTFVAGAVFFSLAFLLSTVFSDVWRPLLIALCAAVVLAACEEALRGLSQYSVFAVMRAERYFRSGHLPWAGLLASMAASAVMLYGAVVIVAKRDF